MQEKRFTVSYAPSATEDILTYAVNSKALYAEIKSIQIANTASSDYEVDVKWVDDSEKNVSATVYHGDGRTVAYYRYDYSSSAMHDIIQNGYIPAGAVLAVLDAPMYLQPKDFLTVKPQNTNSVNKLRALISVVEYYDDGLDLLTVRDLDFRSLDLDFQAARY
jgi:hypothetical protein